VSPSTYVQLAGASDAFEITSSRLAMQRAQTPAVREYARQTMADHPRTTNEILSMPEPAPRASRAMDATQPRMIEQLQSSQGEAFDRLYVAQQIASHNDALRVHRAYAENGDVPALKGFAQRAAPGGRDAPRARDAPGGRDAPRARDAPAAAGQSAELARTVLATGPARGMVRAWGTRAAAPQADRVGAGERP